ncbi:MAG TPA: diguanylate cyclase [Anaerolineales bacterium]|nr:diguanylate cyclase [Anaerolineales bacterium]
MRILVLNNDLMERSVIQQVLQSNKHEIISAQDSAAAMQRLQEGDIRFVIADRTTTDIEETQFIQRLREANPPFYIYILLIASKSGDLDVTSPHTGADDYLHKPVVPLELKSRVFIGERFLSLREDLLRARASADSLAMFNPLTNMLNAPAFLTLAEGELERARRNQAPLSLIALNINNFDEIVEKHGKQIGEDVLVLVSQAIREKSRPYDDVGHYERALFLIPIPFVIGQDAEKIAGRLFKGILNTDVTLLDGTTVRLNIGVGVVSSARITATTEMETLIEKAREALARIKRNGGNQAETIYI